MMVLRTCLFPVDLSNYYMMAFTLIASVFRDDCWGGFLGRLALGCWWMLALQLDLLSRRLGRYLAMVVVFLVKLEVYST